MKKLKYLPILVLSATLLVAIGSCTKSNTGSGSLYTPTSADVTSTATLTELQQGRTLYISNCNSCHGLYSPDDYTSTQWKGILGNMAPNTSMSASQILLVTKYVTRGK
jgi:mono/diheme cytochrome c family protein